MRILYVHERFGDWGGAEASVQITAAEMVARGHAVGILHETVTGKNETAWNQVFPCRFPLTPGHGAECTSQALKAFQPDLVYVNKMANVDVIETLVPQSIPLVRMVHDHDIYCMRSYKYNYFTRRICTRALTRYCVFPCLASLAKKSGGGFPLRWVSFNDKKREVALNRRFDCMVVVTQYMKQELLQNGFDARRIVIHPPVPRMGDPNLRSNFSDRNLIVFAGQIIRGKGVDVLLDCLSMLDLPFECIILGDGNHRPYCERLSRRRGLTDRVTFAGFVPQETLKSYYGECTVVVLSSVWPEPIATVGLEAMRYALPVIAFDAGGIKDWLVDGYNGFLIPWMDRKTYARRLKEVLSDKTLARRLGENGLRLASQRYDFGRYIDDLEAVFQKVIQEGRHK